MRAKEIFEMQAQLCKAMGHPARLEIVHILRDGPRPVNQLAAGTGLSQAALSRHLGALRQVRLVTAQQQGSEHIYQLADPKVGMICDLMRQVLAEQLARQAEMTGTIPRKP